MKSTIYGLVFVICLINFKFSQAHENRESLSKLADHARSLWVTKDHNADYDDDYYDNDDDDDTEEFDSLDKKRGADQPPGTWGKRNNAPSGVWDKRENQPPGVWGKRSNQPPGVWGKRSIYPKKSYKSNNEGGKEDKGDKKSFGALLQKAATTKERGVKFDNEELLTMARYIEKKHALEKRKLALIDTIKRLKNTLGKDD